MIIFLLHFNYLITIINYKMGYLTCASLINITKNELNNIAHAIYDIRIEKNDPYMYLYICAEPLGEDGIPISDRYDKNNITKWMSGEQVKKSSDEIHDEMCYLSDNLPDLLISIKGYGEFNEDIWKAYYYNGKYQQCYAEITFDNYSPDKLKNYKN